MKTKSLFILSGVSLSLAMASASVLSTATSYAEGSDAVDELQVTVNVSCTLSSTLGTTPGVTATTDGEGHNTYTTSLNPQTVKEINGSILTTVCNDSGGYSLYAIGYSGDSYEAPNNTKMLGANSNINTGTATTGDAGSWSMKLAEVSGYIPPTILNNFDNYHVVPGTYTQIAKYTSATAAATSPGATIQAKYQLYTGLQESGTYTGKVKYTIVHPNTAPAPTPPKTYMQEMTAEDCTTTAMKVYDNRDEEPYLVQRLADGKCWMLDNLRLDLSNSTVLNNTTNSNTNASTTTLNYLKNGGGSTSDRYPTAKINNVPWTSSDQNYYSIPMTISTYKDQTTTSYGEGSGKIGVYYNYCAASAGNYCFGDGTDKGSPSGNATEDICPKGWRMPTGDSSGEYQALYTAYSSDATSFRNALSTPLSGYFRSGSAHDQDDYGYFWSSTYSGTGDMYRLRVNSSNVHPSNNDDRYRGLSVRCLLGS